MRTNTMRTVPSVWRHAFVTARAALARDDVATAQAIFDDLASARPDDLEIRLYTAWIRARLARRQTEDARNALEALARRVLGDGHLVALPLCILGHTALHRGELRTARRLFRRAIDADPTLVDARRGERLTAERLAQADVGFLQRDAVARVRHALRPMPSPTMTTD